MALSPMLIIGCGGSGGKIVAGLRRRLEQELRRAGWNEGIPRAWQLVYVDTPAAQEVNLDFGPPLPHTDYISTSSNESVYAGVDDALISHATPNSVERLVDWRPSPDLNLAVDLGAGQWRAVGRAVGFKGLKKFADRIALAQGEFTAGQAQLERLSGLIENTPHLGGAAAGVRPFVIVVSSMAGGTGAGIMPDVCDVVRAVDPSLSSRIMAVLLTAEVFSGIGQAPGLQPNTVAVLGELMAGYFDRGRRLEPLYAGLVQAPVHAVGGSGPSYPFVVGMSTVNGTHLDNVADCYRVVTETVLAAMTRPKVYKDLLEFQVGNWQNNASRQTTRWRFGQGVLAGGELIPGGMVSSFGSSSLAVGSRLFGEYATARLTREVLQFLVDGYIGLGRELLGDPQATAEQVLAFYRDTRGLAFVEACGLRELDLPDSEVNDQVLESLLASRDLNSITGAWLEELRVELAAQGPMRKIRWLDALQQLLPARRGVYLERVRTGVDAGVARLVSHLPTQLAEQTAQTMFECGVPVAAALLRFAQEHVDAAVLQLKDQVRVAREATGRWQDNAMNKLSSLGDRDAVGVDDVRVSGTPQSPGALRLAVLQFGWEEARAMRMQKAADLLDDFSRQVIKPLIAKLEQVAQGLAGSDGREQWSRFPDTQNIPASYRPTPFDFCLIAPERWPTLFTELRNETARREPPGDRVERSGSILLDETVRRLVGGGGFTHLAAGQPVKSPAALTTAGWERGKPAQFTAALSVTDIFGRARLWAERPSMPMGDFIAQNLDSYLAPEGPDGQPIADHRPRLDRFRDLFANALRAATPLVSIDRGLLHRVHPQSEMAEQPARPIIEPLPVTGEARLIAADVLEQHFGVPVARHPNEGGDAMQVFSDGTTKPENILVVSQLQGPVHPAVITSITQPIAAAWSTVSTSQTGIRTFWQYRRARILPESVPVAPQVLDSFIRGWFVGRMLGLIPDPDETNGFRISYLDDIGTVKTAAFPWPLIRCGQWGNTLASPIHRLEWLPAILESLTLAYTLYPTNPSILEAYDHLFHYGVERATVSSWLATGSHPATVAPTQVAGADPQERHAAVIDGLRTTKGIYQSKLSEPIPRDEDRFFTLPYGLSLYPTILSALDGLIQGTPVPESGTGAIG